MVAARVKIKYKIRTMLLLASLAALIDVDHYFGLETRGTLHTIFVTAFIPLILFVLAMKYEKRRDYYKNVSLALFLVLLSHPIADYFTEGCVRFLYPITTDCYEFTGYLYATLPTGQNVYVISSAGIGLTIYFLMILGILFIEDFLKLLKKDKHIEKAFVETVEEEERKIKREL